MTHFIVKTQTDLIVCADGEARASIMVGPGGYAARIYKTRGGARRAVSKYPGRRVVVINDQGFESLEGAA